MISLSHLLNIARNRASKIKQGYIKAPVRPRSFFLDWPVLGGLLWSISNPGEN